MNSIIKDSQMFLAYKIALQNSFNNVKVSTQHKNANNIVYGDINLNGDVNSGGKLVIVRANDNTDAVPKIVFDDGTPSIDLALSPSNKRMLSDQTIEALTEKYNPVSIPGTLTIGAIAKKIVDATTAILSIDASMRSLGDDDLEEDGDAETGDHELIPENYWNIYGCVPPDAKNTTFYVTNRETGEQIDLSHFGKHTPGYEWLTETVDATTEANFDISAAYQTEHSHNVEFVKLYRCVMTSNNELHIYRYITRTRSYLPDGTMVYDPQKLASSGDVVVKHLTSLSAASLFQELFGKSEFNKNGDYVETKGVLSNIMHNAVDTPYAAPSYTNDTHVIMIHDVNPKELPRQLRHNKYESIETQVNNLVASMYSGAKVTFEVSDRVMLGKAQAMIQNPDNPKARMTMGNTTVNMYCNGTLIAKLGMYVNKQLSTDDYLIITDKSTACAASVIRSISYSNGVSFSIPHFNMSYKNAIGLLASTAVCYMAYYDLKRYFQKANKHEFAYVEPKFDSTVYQCAVTLTIKSNFSSATPLIFRALAESGNGLSIVRVSDTGSHINDFDPVSTKQYNDDDSAIARNIIDIIDDPQDDNDKIFSNMIHKRCNEYERFTTGEHREINRKGNRESGDTTTDIAIDEKMSHFELGQETELLALLKTVVNAFANTFNKFEKVIVPGEILTTRRWEDEDVTTGQDSHWKYAGYSVKLNNGSGGDLIACYDHNGEPKVYCQFGGHRDNVVTLGEKDQAGNFVLDPAFVEWYMRAQHIHNFKHRIANTEPEYNMDDYDDSWFNTLHGSRDSEQTTDDEHLDSSSIPGLD